MPTITMSTTMFMGTVNESIDGSSTYYGIRVLTLARPRRSRAHDGIGGHDEDVDG